MCGNQNLQKFGLDRVEQDAFQLLLDEDNIPVKLNKDLFICKPCRVYLVWRSTIQNVDDRPDFKIHRKTVLRRY